MAARGGNNPLRGVLDEGQVRRRGRLSFFVEIYSELSRVTWPDKETAWRLTLLVLGVAVVMGIFLGIIWDTLLATVVERLFLS
jgi:preprotein translocase SecE subunit